MPIGIGIRKESGVFMVMQAVIGILGGLCVGTVIGGMMQECFDGIMETREKKLPKGVTETVYDTGNGIIRQVIDRRRIMLEDDLEFCEYCYDLERHLIGVYIGDGHYLIYKDGYSSYIFGSGRLRGIKTVEL